MECIIVVDDREEMRSSIVASIELALEDFGINWDVIPLEPLKSVEDYADLVVGHDLRVLVLDEKLAEGVGADGVAVDYAGHQVARFMRQRYPDLPQVIITAIKNTEDLDSAAELDAIVQRDEFSKHTEVWVERMIRLGQSFALRNEAELADLARISASAASSTLSEDDKMRLQAIREKRLLVASADNMIGMSEWLGEAERVRDVLATVLAKIKEDKG